jgi:hypothetical protein
MSTHQINNIWDWVIVGTVWVIGLAYKSISLSLVWLAGLIHWYLSFSLASFNEGLHTVVLVAGGVLTFAKLGSMARGWIKENGITITKKKRKKK